MKNQFVYIVSKLSKPLKIDGDWQKNEWSQAETLTISNCMGKVPDFKPVVKAKMMYDENNLYVIFNVSDRYVRCITNTINGPVWEDSCVEFFFSPDTEYPERYFNLEVNCGGTPLMHYNVIPDVNIRKLDIADIGMIEIAHSLPPKSDPEITFPVNWTVEYKIPLELVGKYSGLTNPQPGVEWRANFFKIAENNSNPHYITWAPVDNPEPNFHLPHFFGLIKFQ
jgi:hypothetical protein